MVFVLILYDLVVVLEVVYCVVVMYVGEIIEINCVFDIFCVLYYLYIEVLFVVIFEYNKGVCCFVVLFGMVLGCDDCLFGCLFVLCCKYVVDDCCKVWLVFDMLVLVNDVMCVCCIKLFNVFNFDLMGGV